MTTQRRIAKRRPQERRKPTGGRWEFWSGQTVQMSGKKVTCATVESSPEGKRLISNLHQPKTKVEDERVQMSEKAVRNLGNAASGLWCAFVQTFVPGAWVDSVDIILQKNFCAHECVIVTVVMNWNLRGNFRASLAFYKPNKNNFSAKLKVFRKSTCLFVHHSLSHRSRLFLKKSVDQWFPQVMWISLRLWNDSRLLHFHVSLSYRGTLTSSSLLLTYNTLTSCFLSRRFFLAWTLFLLCLIFSWSTVV